jgi:hypothetical protein
MKYRAYIQFHRSTFGINNDSLVNPEDTSPTYDVDLEWYLSGTGLVLFGLQQSSDCLKSRHLIPKAAVGCDLMLATHALLFAEAVARSGFSCLGRLCHREAGFVEGRPEVCVLNGRKGNRLSCIQTS